MQPKGGKNEKVPGGDQKVQRNDDKRKEKDEANAFNSPNIKAKMDMKKAHSDKPDLKGAANMSSKKESNAGKMEKKNTDEPKAMGISEKKETEASKGANSQVA